MPHQAHSVVEAATVLGCSPRTIRWHLRAGVLSGVKLGRDWVVWGPLDPADTAGQGPRAHPERGALCLAWRRAGGLGALVCAQLLRVPGTDMLRLAELAQ